MGGPVYSKYSMFSSTYIASKWQPRETGGQNPVCLIHLVALVYSPSPNTPQLPAFVAAVATSAE
jgi:hypothetical protein